MNKCWRGKTTIYVKVRKWKWNMKYRKWKMEIWKKGNGKGKRKWKMDMENGKWKLKYWIKRWSVEWSWYIVIFSEKTYINNFLLLVSFIFLIFYLKKKLSLLYFHDEELENWSWLETCWVFTINIWRLFGTFQVWPKTIWSIFDGWKHMNIWLQM